MNKLKLATILGATIMTVGCTTPMTTLKNDKTGQVVTCGGSSTGSFVGGAIGYHMQKGNDQDCVQNYQKQGFTIIDQKS